MLLKDSFYDESAKTIITTHLSTRLDDSETTRWKIAHLDVRHYFEAALYHFGRMLRANHFNNPKVMEFEHDAFITTLYSVREHLLQELNVFFCLGIPEDEIHFNTRFKTSLQTRLELVSRNQVRNILDILENLNNEEWFRYLKERRHTITHRPSKPEVVGVSLRWDNEPPRPMLNTKFSAIYGGDYREAVLKFWPKAPTYYDWLAESSLTINLFKKWMEEIWNETASSS